MIHSPVIPILKICFKLGSITSIVGLHKHGMAQSILNRLHTSTGENFDISDMHIENLTEHIVDAVAIYTHTYIDNTEYHESCNA